MGLRFDHHAGISSGRAVWTPVAAATAERFLWRNVLSIVTAPGHPISAGFLGTLNRLVFLAPDKKAIDSLPRVARRPERLGSFLFPGLDPNDPLNHDAKVKTVGRRPPCGDRAMVTVAR